jgi:class 3 adenylate cyclase
VVDRGDDAQLASRLEEVARDRSRLVAWMDAAARRAPDHAAEIWYRRRAEWTFEAHERHLRSG